MTFLKNSGECKASSYVFIRFCSRAAIAIPVKLEDLAHFRRFGLALGLLFLKAQMRNEKEQLKSAGQVPLRLIYARSVSFTLPIQRKELHPALFPFSSKKLTSKDAKDECDRQLQP